MRDTMINADITPGEPVPHTAEDIFAGTDWIDLVNDTDKFTIGDTIMVASDGLARVRWYGDDTVLIDRWHADSEWLTWEVVYTEELEVYFDTLPANVFWLRCK